MESITFQFLRDVGVSVPGKIFIVRKPDNNIFPGQEAIYMGNACCGEKSGAYVRGWGAGEGVPESERRRVMQRGDREIGGSHCRDSIEWNRDRVRVHIPSTTPPKSEGPPCGNARRVRLPVSGLLDSRRKK